MSMGFTRDNNPKKCFSQTNLITRTNLKEMWNSSNLNRQLKSKDSLHSCQKLIKTLEK